MSKAFRLLVIGIVSTVVLSFAAPSAFAQTSLTSEQISRIQTNCVAIKNTLNQLHASDALLRVNRGQVYESMASKLMDNFNNRLSSNRLDAKGTVAVTTSYRAALDDFRNNYRQYELKLSQAIRTDCTNNTEEFHFVTEEARELRKVVHDDVLRLHRYIDDYRSAVSDFLLNFERVSN